MELGPELTREAIDDLDELAGGPGVGVVGEVPNLARGVGVLARVARPSPMSGM
jgi:hypothetical protein